MNCVSAHCRLSLRERAIRLPHLEHDRSRSEQVSRPFAERKATLAGSVVPHSSTFRLFAEHAAHQVVNGGILIRQNNLGLQLQKVLQPLLL